MKIAYITAGAGGMYCGSCMHDNTLAAALMQLGHEVALIPTYTPTRTDEKSVALQHVFLSGINIYLQSKYRFFRKTPAFIDRLFENRRLLTWSTKYAASTDARELGYLTETILQGDEGFARKEFIKLVAWLKNEFRPDVVELTNSMFVGFAGLLKKELGVPVICAMQGEDIFLDNLVEPYKSHVFEILRKKVTAVDGFIATCEYYRYFMADYLHVPQEKIHSVRLGINLEGYGLPQQRAKRDHLTVGFLARICPEKGLHQLIDAGQLLLQNEPDFPLKLKIAGYLDKKDAAWFAGLKNQIAAAKIADRVEIIGEVDRAGKIAFFKEIDVLCVPTVYVEPKALFVLEALANGVPVIEPNHGIFPELIEKTAGGLLFQPGSIQDLVETIRQVFAQPQRLQEMGRRGYEAVTRHFNDRVMAQETLAIYERYREKLALQGVCEHRAA